MSGDLDREGVEDRDKDVQEILWHIFSMYNQRYRVDFQGLPSDEAEKATSLIMLEYTIKLERYRHDDIQLAKSLWQKQSDAYMQEVIVSAGNVSEAKRKFLDRGLEPHVFNEARLNDVFDALGEKKSVENVDIIEKLKNPLFRFITIDRPFLSGRVSEALSIIYREAKKLAPDVQKMGRDKQKENADDFALRMHDIIRGLQREEKLSSYRETVNSLNDKKISSYRGGEWHVNTLQQLQKRWKEMGLIPDEPKKPKKPKPE